MLNTITDYSPPTTTDLQRLKAKLGYTSEQMADLLAVAGGNQWRKYTGGKTSRSLGPHYLFFLAARLTLTSSEFDRVLYTMRKLGADFSFQAKHSCGTT